MILKSLFHARHKRGEMLKLKCAGGVSGVVDVGESATVGELLHALEKLAGTDAGGLKVIAGGKKIDTADKDASMRDVGITAASRLVVSRTGVGTNPGSYDAQAGRLQRLERIQKAAEAIAARSGSHSRRAFALETQEGRALQGEGSCRVEGAREWSSLLVLSDATDGSC